MNIPKLICPIIFIIAFSFIKTSPIKLEFKSGLCKGYENKEFLSNYYNQYLFTTISIGSNNQKIDLALKLNRYITYITGSGNSQLKSEFFDEKNSNTYKQLEEKETESTEDEFFISYKSKDNINFGDKLTFNNFIFFLSQKQYFDESGHIGLKMLPADMDKNKFLSYNFISQLKSNLLINSQYFYFKFNNIENNNEFNYNGYLILGATPHEFEENDLFKEKNFHEIYAKIDEDLNTRWNLEILEVKYGNNVLSKNDLGEFSTTFGFIVAPLSFFDIYDKFFSKNKCYGDYNGDKDDKNYIYFYCEEGVDLTKFENVIITTKDKEMKFVLNYKDLFRKIGNYYYFLILFNQDISEWIFGHIFLSKYTIVFNPEKKTIGYYNDNTNLENNFLNDNKNKNTIIIFVVLSIIFLAIIVGLLIYMFYYRPRYRKIRPNELEENFDYSPNDNDLREKSKLGV